MGGLLGGVTDVLFGSAPKAKAPGAFWGSAALAQEYQPWLLERLTTPVTESEQFGVGSQAIRDALTTQSATARQRLGDMAVQGGNLDAGAIMAGNLDISRAESAAYANEIAALTMGLYDRQDANIYPYLSGGSTEGTQIAGMNLGAKLQHEQMGTEFIMRNIESVGDFFSGMASGPMG